MVTKFLLQLIFSHSTYNIADTVLNIKIPVVIMITVTFLAVTQRR
jgi:hypothetical protein